MSDDDEWRRRAAERQFGESLTPGFARNPARPPIPVRASSEEIYKPSANSLTPELVTDRAPTPPLLAPVTSTQSVVRRRPTMLGWWPVGIVLFCLAALTAWFARPAAQGQNYAATAPAPMPAASILGPATPVQTAETVPVSTAAPATSSVSQLASKVNSQVKRHGHSNMIERLVGPAPVKITSSDMVSPRSDRSTPSQAPSAVVHARKSPSFECRANQGEITAAICADRKLSSLDRQLAARFAALDASVDPATIEALHHAETTFLNERQLCTDKACLAKAYSNRLLELETLKP